MVENTLNIGKISEGFVLDHIKAGKSMDIYKYLKLDQLDCCVAIIKNAKSNKMGKKDIIKIECPIDIIDLDILGFIDHNITVNIIEDSKIVEKKELKLPSEIKNVIRCHNPRCITSIEQGLDHVFVLTDPENEVYRCKYCEEKIQQKAGLASACWTRRTGATQRTHEKRNFFHASFIFCLLRTVRKEILVLLVLFSAVCLSGTAYSGC